MIGYTIRMDGTYTVHVHVSGLDLTFSAIDYHFDRGAKFDCENRDFAYELDWHIADFVRRQRAADSRLYELSTNHLNAKSDEIERSAFVRLKLMRIADEENGTE